MKITEVEVCSECYNSDSCTECVKESMLNEDTVLRISDLFKALGDSTRIKIIDALFKKELCVCDIAEVLNMSQSSISHQLRILKSVRLVKFRKEGKSVYYSLDDNHINELFNSALEHVKHS